MFEHTGIDFIDLFSGIGGFHQAMKLLDENNENVTTNFVIASEIDTHAIKTYDKNYFSSDSEQTSANDVTNFVDITTDTLDERLHNFNFMCAGFPCQAFSKAGKREGFLDQTKGTLFFNLQDILTHRVEMGNPVQFLLLENVSNLVTHDGGNTWDVIENVLTQLGYVLTRNPLQLSPHQFGIPQLRNRVFIPAVHESVYLEVFNTDVPEVLELDILTRDMNRVGTRTRKNITNLFTPQIFNVNDKFDVEKYKVSDIQLKVIRFWNEFMFLTTNGEYNRTLGFPIWLEYFGREVQATELYDMPGWKRSIVERNIALYNENKRAFDLFLNENRELLNEMTPTHRKFEWQAGTDLNNINEGILQFRPSGLRVKRPTEAPALVAIVHVPIIYDKYNQVFRKLTPREMARLQSFPEDFELDEVDQQAYKQLGNSVNVEVIHQILEAMNRLPH